MWSSFSPVQIQNLQKNEINQPSPQLSEPTKPKSPWKISIPHASGNLHNWLNIPNLFLNII